MDNLRSASLPLHVVCGTYDFLQPGNLAAIQLASEDAGSLLIVLPDDKSVAAYTDTQRPYHPAADRCSFLKDLNNITQLSVLASEETDTFFQSLPPYTLFTCDNHPGPLTNSAARFAERAEQLPVITACSTPDVVSAIQENRTPVSVNTEMPIGPDSLNAPRVTVNGCFDILHLGHLDMLKKARAMGGSLTVLINSDDSVRRYKGDTRPVFPESFRAQALKALDCVDHVVCFDDDDPLALLTELKPDIHVKGGSYEPERVRAEKELLESWGGEVRFCPLLEGFSTSSIIQAVG